MGDGVTKGDGYAVGDLDSIGEGYGFRKIRRELVGGKDGYVGRNGQLPEGETRVPPGRASG